MRRKRKHQLVLPKGRVKRNQKIMPQRIAHRGKVHGIVLAGGGGAGTPQDIATSRIDRAGAVFAPTFNQAGLPTTGYTFPTTLYRCPAFPTFVNVKTWNANPALCAKGDGVTNDTAAIQAAINSTQNDEAPRAIYFPDGTYMVNQQLSRPGVDGANWTAQFWIQGESETGTIIKLMNSSTGFTDPANQKSVILQVSSINYSTLSLAEFNAYLGPGADAYRNHVMDITINLGAGNHGAIGIDSLHSNQGADRRVTIDGTLSGYAGICVRRGFSYYGPGIWSRITVIGCRYGFDMRGVWSEPLAEHVKLRNQTVAGMRIEHCPMEVRGVDSDQSTTHVPVVDIVPGNVIPTTFGPAVSIPNGGSSMAGLCIIEGKFIGGSGGSAIQNRSPNGKVYARDITISGYGSVVSENGVPKAWPVSNEYTTDPQVALGAFSSTQRLWEVPAKTMRLPIRETPETNVNTSPTVTPALSTMTAARAPSGSDHAVQIQQDIDACQTPILYFGGYKYRMSGAGPTIHVRGNVRRLVMNGAYFFIDGPGYSESNPMFKIDDLGASVTTIIQGPWRRSAYHAGSPDWPSFDWVSASTGALVFIDAYVGGYATSIANPGPLFIDDVLGGHSETNRQDMWARQYNADAGGTVKNSTGDWWIFGSKSEVASNTFFTVNGGRMEVFGIDGAYTADPSGPAFFIIGANAAFSAAGCLTGSFNGIPEPFVSETQADGLRTLSNTKLPFRGSAGKWLNLYRSKL